MSGITLGEVYVLFNAAVREAGSESAFARKHGLTRQEVHEARKSSRHPGPRVLAAIGLVKVVTVRYERIAIALSTSADPGMPPAGSCACHTNVAQVLVEMGRAG